MNQHDVAASCRSWWVWILFLLWQSDAIFFNFKASSLKQNTQYIMTYLYMLSLHCCSHHTMGHVARHPLQGLLLLVPCHVRLSSLQLIQDLVPVDETYQYQLPIFRSCSCVAVTQHQDSNGHQGDRLYCDYDKIQDSRFLLYQQYHTNGSTIMTKTDVHTNTNLTSMSAMT